MQKILNDAFLYELLTDFKEGKVIKFDDIYILLDVEA